MTRLEEAAQILPKERLALSPQCGFASTEEGNLLSEEEQWAKIRLVRELAEDFGVNKPIKRKGATDDCQY